MSDYFKHVNNQSLSYSDVTRSLANALNQESGGGWKDEVGSSYRAYTSMVGKIGDAIVEYVAALASTEASISEKPLEKLKGKREMLERELRSLK